MRTYPVSGGRRAVPLLLSLAAVVTLGAAAPPVGMHAKPLPASPKCITTTISKITARLESDDPSTGKEIPMPDSGSNVMIRGKLPDPYIHSIEPEVVFYQEAPENKMVALERAGDKVQACIIEVPQPDDAGCNPRQDGRGRVIRVYDYKHGFAYAGPNSEHLCGGA